MEWDGKHKGFQMLYFSKGTQNCSFVSPNAEESHLLELGNPSYILIHFGIKTEKENP